jgi:sortase A
MTGNRHHRRSFSSAAVQAFLEFFAFILSTAGILALAYVAFLFVVRQSYQADKSWQLKHSATLDLRAPPPAGSVIGKLEIPRIGMDTIVVQGDSDSILKLAVGHLPGTPLPGQTGNMVLAGHRDTFFRPLRNIRIGDHIVMESPNGFHDYVVESASVVAPTDLSVLQSSGSPELTLITCYPFSWIGSAPDRFVVRAR